MDNFSSKDDFKTALAGSTGGQMPTAGELDDMNHSLGLTSRRYGATAPDPNSVEAIASRKIDQMGLMAAEDGLPSGKDSGLIRQFAADMGKAHFKKLVGDLSRMAAKLPGEIIKSRRSPDPAAYLRYMAGDKSGR